MKIETLQDKIKAMIVPLANFEYYAFTITANENREISVLVHFADFIGFSNGKGTVVDFNKNKQKIDKKPIRFSDIKPYTPDEINQQKIELHVAAKVDPVKMGSLWSDIDEPYVIVNNAQELGLYLLVGGHCCVEESLAEKYLPSFIGSQEYYLSGPYGFKKLAKCLPNNAKNRAPTPKQRMRIIKRDDYRCKVCGRRPADYVDVELHLHHIRPWALGGLTIDENLITLCHTCHKGLDPHNEPNLFYIAEPDKWELNFSESKKELFYGIKRYRKIVNSGIEDE